jgi:hypothetical protein
MKSCLQLAAFTLMCTLLTACDKAGHSDYLQHPKELQVLVNQCQMNPPTSPEQALKCKDILYAAKEVLNLIDHMQSNPQQFGERLLRAQMQSAVLAQSLNDLDEKIKALQAQPGSDQQLQGLQDELHKQQAASQQILLQINHYLAVLGLGSPE